MPTKGRVSNLYQNIFLSWHTFPESFNLYSSKLIALPSSVVGSIDCSDGFFFNGETGSCKNIDRSKMPKHTICKQKLVAAIQDLINYVLGALLTCGLTGCSSHWRFFHKWCRNRQSARQNVSPPRGFSPLPSACLIFHRSCRQIDLTGDPSRCIPPTHRHQGLHKKRSKYSRIN